MPIDDLPNQDLGNGFKLLDRNGQFFDISGQSMVSPSQAAWEAHGNGMNETTGSARDLIRAAGLARLRPVPVGGVQVKAQVEADQSRGTRKGGHLHYDPAPANPGLDAPTPRKTAG